MHRLLPRGGLLRRLSTAAEPATTPSPPPPRPQVDSLYHRVCAVAIPNLLLTPVLEQWAFVEGRPVKKHNLQVMVKKLVGLRRFSHALELSMWMTNRRHFPLSAGDVAYRLDLISKVHGLESAVEYFGNVPKQLLKPQCYGSLLKCYVEAKSVEKAEELFLKIQEMGLKSSYAYNMMMQLYLGTGQVERVCTMYRAMEESGVKPDIFSINKLMGAYIAAEDVKGIEEVLEKDNPHELLVNWHSYATSARVFMKCGLQERALQCFQESEKRIDLKNGKVAYGFLLSTYADLGMRSQVDRIWDVYKSKLPVLNSMYMCRITALIKMNDIDGAEKAFEEWESRCVNYDARLVSLLVDAYCKEGLLDKAEALVDEAIKKGRIPYANTWYRLAGGFFKDGQVSKAVDLTKKSLASASSGWKPDLANVLMSLDHFVVQKNVEAAEEMASLLQRLVPLTRDVYHTLLKIYVHARRPVSDLLDRMKKDGLEADEETNRILAGECL